MRRRPPGPRCFDSLPDALRSPSIPPATGSPPTASRAASATIRRISRLRGFAPRIGPVGGSDRSFWREDRRATQGWRWGRATWRHSLWRQSGQRGRLWYCSRCISGRSSGCDGRVHGACGEEVDPVQSMIRCAHSTEWKRETHEKEVRFGVELRSGELRHDGREGVLGQTIVCEEESGLDYNVRLLATVATTCSGLLS